MGSDPRQDRTVEVGLVLRDGDLRAYRGRLAELTAIVAGAGLDHVTVGDHISFAGGNGADGLVQATALLSSHPTLPVQTGVYLLALRHPAVVARQLVDNLRHRARAPHVRRRRRRRRPARARAVRRGAQDARRAHIGGARAAARVPDRRGGHVRRALLQRGAAPPSGPHRGHRPRSSSGGRSDAALRRTGRLGDGWLALWVSPRRYTEGVGLVQEAAEEAGRPDVAWEHTLQLWTGFDRTHERAVARLRPVMERAYGMEFERFARYAPCGRPEDVAAELEPFLRAGCRRFNLVFEADGLDAAAAAAAELKDLLSNAADWTPRRQEVTLETHQRRATACRHWNFNRRLSATTPGLLAGRRSVERLRRACATSIADRVALVLEDRAVTYAELRRAAVGISNRLADAGRRAGGGRGPARPPLDRGRRRDARVPAPRRRARSAAADVQRDAAVGAGRADAARGRS